MNWPQVAALIVTVGAGFATWMLGERSKRRHDDYVRREARYAQLVRAIRGFYSQSADAKVKARFLTELELSWLYGSDEVVRAAYDFLRTMTTGSSSSDTERTEALGELMLAMRRDLLERKPLKSTDLCAEEFRVLLITPDDSGDR